MYACVARGGAAHLSSGSGHTVDVLGSQAEAHGDVTELEQDDGSGEVGVHQEGDEVDVGGLHAWQQGIGWQAGGAVSSEQSCHLETAWQAGAWSAEGRTAERPAETTTWHRLAGWRAAAARRRAVHRAAKGWLIGLSMMSSVQSCSCGNTALVDRPGHCQPRQSCLA